MSRGQFFHMLKRDPSSFRTARSKSFTFTLFQNECVFRVCMWVVKYPHTHTFNVCMYILPPMRSYNAQFNPKLFFWGLESQTGRQMYMVRFFGWVFFSSLRLRSFTCQTDIQSSRLFFFGTIALSSLFLLIHKKNFFSPFPFIVLALVVKGKKQGAGKGESNSVSSLKSIKIFRPFLWLQILHTSICLLVPFLQRNKHRQYKSAITNEPNYLNTLKTELRTHTANHYFTSTELIS